VTFVRTFVSFVFSSSSEMPDASQPDLTDFARRIDLAMQADRFRLRRELRSLEQAIAAGKPFDRSLARLSELLDKSAARVETRRRNLPKIAYDAALPITEHVKEIADAIHTHPCVVLCGETGSGKSTQIPKICLEMGRGITGLIGHTQPRRIAARSVATRVAEELGTSVGQGVGFKVRFTDATGPNTYIKLMTDGILLAETQSDRFLDQYDTLIIDEAHERSLNIDFLLGYIKRLLPKRPGLRLIITSATIDAARFADFFSSQNGPAPVIQVAGRTFPVETWYRPLQAEDEDSEDVDVIRGVADAVEEVCHAGEGDILVFMPSERDIRETHNVLKGLRVGGPAPEILPLYGRLSEKDQNRIFQPHTGRRIVIATNVAESSLTVPGIRYVIDPGTARISRYAPQSKVQRLPIEPISKASADQRKGRCGRVAPGICVRLYSEQDYLNREPFTAPEIQRTNLAAVILQTKALGLGRIEEFPFLEPPSPAAIRSGTRTLFELGAFNEREELTPIGRSLAKLPVDPRIGRMIIEADREQCLTELLIIAAALEIRDPRERPIEHQQAADEAHRKFSHESSDFLSFLKLWDQFQAWDDELTRNQLQKTCHKNFLSFMRMREWRDLFQQLREMAEAAGLKTTKRHDDPAAIHRAVLSGLLSNIAQRGETHEYTGAGGQTFVLWPGSVLFKSKPKWIVAAELVETTRRYARVVAGIDPAAVEKLAVHLTKKTYTDPQWDRKSSSVMANEKVLLFGLPIVSQRRVRFGPVNPKEARPIFIEHALVHHDFDTTAQFHKHNVELKEELSGWQAKLRQSQLFASEEAQFRFFDDLLPPDVYDGPTLDRWRRDAEKTNPKALYLTKEVLLTDPETILHGDLFPDRLKIGSMDLAVEYSLDPGQSRDGVTVIVPQEGLNQLNEGRLGWLVPGLLEDKIAALIKSLPKDLRRAFVPIPETAQEVAAKLKFGEGELLSQVAAILRQISGEHVPVDAFDIARLPEHLKANVRLVDRAGKTVAESREVGSLQQKVGSSSSQVLTTSREEQWHRDGLTDWTFDLLPQQATIRRGGVDVVAFPTLIDRGDAVGMRLLLDAPAAEWLTRVALVRLYGNSNRKPIKEQVAWLPKLNQISMLAMALPKEDVPLPGAALPKDSPAPTSFDRQLELRLAERSFFADAALPRTQPAYRDRVNKARGMLSVAVQDLSGLLEPIVTGYHGLKKLLDAAKAPLLQTTANDLRRQLQHLFAPDFLWRAPWPWLQQYPRYLEAMTLRWQRMNAGGFERDQKLLAQLQPHQIRYWQQFVRQSPELTYDRWGEPVRWLLEEYRVSLFAQQLRTAVPVSEKRIQQAWQEMAAR
jgi:ATP-dependent helicase HrpA